MAVPLLFLYGSFLLWFVLDSSFLPTDRLGGLVLATAVGRMALILSFKRLRKGSPALVVDVLSAEVLAIPFLAVAYFLLGNPLFISEMKELFSVWPAAFLLVLPAYIIYKLADLMRESTSPLTAVLPSATGVFALLSLLTTMSTLSSHSRGLEGFPTLLVSALSSSFLGSVAPQGSLWDVAVAGILLYVVLMVYAVTKEKDQSISLELALSFAVLASLIALGWALLASHVTGPPSLDFDLPGLTILAIVWWVSRAH
jgi:hypothetical protein